MIKPNKIQTPKTLAMITFPSEYVIITYLEIRRDSSFFFSIFFQMNMNKTYEVFHAGISKYDLLK
jgi:hypothetical protein